MIKLALGTKKKIIKLQKPDFSALRALIKQSFPDAPADHLLSYLDQDKDEISLNSDEDLHIMLSAGLKINNVYIKQSLSQTIEVTDVIDPSFEIYDSHIRKPAPASQNSNEVKEALKEEIEVAEEAVGERGELEQAMKSVEVQAPIYHSIDLPIEESNQVEKVQSKNEAVDLQVSQQLPVGTKVEEKEGRRPASEKRIQVFQEWPSENSKSFDISVAESNRAINRVQIDDAILSQKIELLFRKHLEEKELLQKEWLRKEQIKKEEPKQKEEPVENRQIIEAEVRPRGKIFSKDSPKKARMDCELIYHGVICSNCKDEYGIIGIRYQCITCQAFNLCQQCEPSANHKHALLKVKHPSQIFKKDEFIDMHRREIFTNVIPPGHYVPCISKQEADRFITTSKQMVNESMERAQRMINDMFLKMEMSHKNPYEQHKPMLDKPLVTISEKIQHLKFLFEMDDRQAKYFCDIHPHLSKEQLADLYVRKKAERK